MIKRRKIHLCVEIWTFTVVMLLVFAYLTSSWNNIFFAIVNSLFASITLAVVIETIRKCSINNIHSGAEALLLVTAIYNYNSITKLMSEQGYAGLIDDPLARLLGNIYIDFVIIISTLIWWNYHSHHASAFHIKFETIHMPRFVAYFFTLIYVFLELFCIRAFNSDLYNYSLSLSVMLTSFVMCYIYFTYAIAFLVANESKKITDIFGFLPLIAILIVNLYISMMTGKRNFLIAFVFIILCDFIVSGKVKYKIIEMLSILSAPFLMIFSMISFGISNRMESFTSASFINYMSNRYDLSDFAITIATRFFRGTNQIEVIIAAINEALPHNLFPNIVKGNMAYYENLLSMGLKTTDYSDTIFSMGAQLLGFLGIFLVFLLFLFFYEWLTRKIIKIKKIGITLFVIIMNYFVMIENSWSKFFASTRDMLILLIFSFFIMQIIVRYKKHKSEHQYRNLDDI